MAISSEEKIFSSEGLDYSSEEVSRFFRGNQIFLGENRAVPGRRFVQPCRET